VTSAGPPDYVLFVDTQAVGEIELERILFLVDRGNLGDQTFKEFQGFEVAGSGRKFTEFSTSNI